MDQFQMVSATYFADRSESNFRKYYDKFFPIVYNTSYYILRDVEKAWENVNNVFLKMHTTTTFLFDAEKSHKSYIMTLASNHAKMLHNKYKKTKYILESSVMQNTDEEMSVSILDIMSSAMNYEGLDKADLTEVLDNSLLKEEIIKAIEIISSSDKQLEMILMDIFINRVLHDEIVIMHGFQDIKELNVYISRFRRRITKIVMNSEFFNMHKYQIKPRFEEKVDNDIEIQDENNILYKRICNIIKNLNAEFSDYDPVNETGLLVDAMINRINYDSLKEKYGLNSVGAIKTRVCRAKSKILEFMKMDYNSESLVNNPGNDFTMKTRLFHEDEITVKSVFALKDGELDGLCVTYHENGQKSTVYNYMNGFKHGNCMEYDKNGKLIFVGNYVMGKKEGIFRINEEDTEELALNMEYENGKLVYSEIYENGKISKTSLVVN